MKAQGGRAVGTDLAQAGQLSVRRSSAYASAMAEYMIMPPGHSD
eukprot:COSAG04_NODE_12957_length_626_cov_1.005693_2_plen_43_part_01